MESIRVLFVDDEPGIRTTLPAILEQQGFTVTAVGRVDEALAAITSAQFDVLVSDLNIGQPGDGFVVVSAMRRTQPNCVTLILTGFPGFESALQAIRSQVDDYLIKPTPVPTLVNLIKNKLAEHQPGTATANKRIAHLLRENTFEIAQRALKYMKADPLLRKLPIKDEERIQHTPHALEELAAMLASPETDQATATSVHAAEMRGAKRLMLGYTIPLLAVHLRLVERAIYEVIQENLLSLNLSYLMLDLRLLNDALSVQLEYTLRGYLEAERRGARNRDLTREAT